MADVVLGEVVAACQALGADDLVELKRRIDALAAQRSGVTPAVRTQDARALQVVQLLRMQSACAPS